MLVGTQVTVKNLELFSIMRNMRSMNTKSRLVRDKITENDKCYLCNSSQTQTHLFVECAFSKEFCGAVGLGLLLGEIQKNYFADQPQKRNIPFVIYPEKQSYLGINHCLILYRYKN